MRTSVRSLVLAVCLWLTGAVAAHAVELQWWSHWAIEDSKKAVLFEVKRRFEAKNPGHTVTITFYEKKNMWPALRAAFTAGSGFPDVFYYDMDVPEFMTTGWLADLSTGVHWEEHRAVRQGVLDPAGPGRQEWHLGHPRRGGVGRALLQPEALQGAEHHGAGRLRLHPGSAQGGRREVRQGRSRGVRHRRIGSRLGGPLHPERAPHDRLGADEFMRLLRARSRGRIPGWSKCFRYYRELIDLGAYAKTLSSMTLAEAHRYFHTEQKACMFPVGSWYTGRAFVPPDKGGQPKDFELGMLNNTLMKDGKGHGQKFLGVAGSLGRRRQEPEPGPRGEGRRHVRRRRDRATCGWRRPASRPASRPTRRASTARSMVLRRIRPREQGDEVGRPDRRSRSVLS